jgi:predicted alpha/beta superfamily hydrolase
MEQTLPWALEKAECFELDAPMGLRFEVSIALPISYGNDGRHYPALFVLDSPATFPIAAVTARGQSWIGAAHELIVVGISTPRRESLQEIGLQRLRYLSPGPPPRDDPSIQAVMRALEAARVARGWSFEDCFGGAPAFLRDLTDTLVPAVARRARIDTSDLGLLGHSAAGAFVAFALLSRTPAFRRYTAGTFGTAWFPDLERSLRDFERGSGQAVQVFHGVGGAELADAGLIGAHQGLQLMQRFQGLARADLAVHAQVFEGENHASVIPHLIASAIRHHYGTGLDLVAGLAARPKRG